MCKYDWVFLTYFFNAAGESLHFQYFDSSCMIIFFSDLLELSINNYIVEISLDYIGSEMSGLTTHGFLMNT